MNQRTMLVVYHSRTGGAQQMTEAFAAAAGSVEGVVVRLRPADQIDAAEMLLGDGYAFIAPENLGGLTGVMKEFFDRTYYPLLDQIQGRPYCSLVAAGSDGHGAARQIGRIVTGWRLKAVAEPLIVSFAAQTPQAILAPKQLTATDRQRCEERGQLMATGLALSIF